MEHSARHTVIFTTALCVVFSLLVSAVAVALKDRQDENQRLDRIKNVLLAAGLSQRGESLSRDELNQRFEQKLEAKLVDLAKGNFVDTDDALDYDQRRAAKDPDRSRPAPDNGAKVQRVPDLGLVYLIRGESGGVDGVVLPVEGYGLWSTMYGYLALEADLRTVRGITFYEHGETPGLGGEIANPRWQAGWPGRQAIDEKGEPRLRVKKGTAGPPERDPYQVDGLSGATITSNGVTNMLSFWLGDAAFGPFLDSYRNQQEAG